MTTPRELPLDKLEAHPDNPRIIPADDVIDMIAQSIRDRGSFDPAHAIKARPYNGHYQIVSGHNRTKAAHKAGLKTIPAWVSEMSDEDAFMCLILDNAQRELTPLERGTHALNFVQKDSKKGKSIAAYVRDAKRTDEAAVRNELWAAEVFKQSGHVTGLHNYFSQLKKIHAAPDHCWPILCERLVEKNWTVEEVEKVVRAIKEIKAPEKTGHIWRKEDLQLRLAEKPTTFAKQFDRAVAAYEQAQHHIAVLNFHTKEALSELDAAVKELKDRCSPADITACADAILTRLQTELDAEEEEAKKKTKKLKGAVTLSTWNLTGEVERSQILSLRSDKIDFTEQKGESIEWARFSWNPVSGCDHNCPYCYARDLALRYYPQGFEPSIWPGRIAAPANTKVPAEANEDVGYRNVFTCSMADLFGQWVPREWIEWVLREVAANPQWNFLFLTKFPQRYAEFEFPDNAWIGTSVDLQARVKNAEKAMAKVKAKVKWLSLEPLLEPLEIDLSQFQWIVIGGASKSNETPEWVPPKHWVIRLTEAAHRAGCAVYWKTNLDPVAFSEKAEDFGTFRLREYPGRMEAKPELPTVFKYLKVL